jgi:DNA mismatch endonuclease (patch repair protein)
MRGLWNYAKGLPGTPDIAFMERKIAVFLDSCFWHGCPKHLRRPSSNQTYWEAKIKNNIKRDRRQRAALRRLGWSVLRIWEHDLKNPASIVKKIYRVLEGRGQG